MEFIEILLKSMVEQVQSFGPFLRKNGFRVSITESLNAATALTLLDIESMEQVMDGLRSIYAKSPAEWSAFPSLFKRHFCVDQHTLKLPKTLEEDPGLSNAGNSYREVASSFQTTGGLLPAYSPDLGQRYPIRIVNEGGLGEMLHWAEKSVLQMKRPRSRRFKEGRRPRFDFRRTLRNAVKNGGEPFVLFKREYRQARPQIVMVADISGSMKAYADFFLTMAWAFMQSRARIEVFVFSTDLKRITPYLSHKLFKGIPEEQLMGLKGGTRIGFSLSRLASRYESLLRKNTHLIIVSDGFDTGDPRVLRQTMDYLSKRAGQLVWINPLLGEQEYEPVSMGMKTALPYLDRFVDIHDRKTWAEAVRTNIFSGNRS
ncbi:vWA domain-containing protein [Ferviditalea candida]|uniref:VWA domain-containing protein n=1 Tax=Ferviditalea candida TaxID=3108399 RepID=A0ABU5ZFX9_9BACL|nr:VWA domain-containing protein [Paenibacillaceae bacterium T2]